MARWHLLGVISLLPACTGNPLEMCTGPTVSIPGGPCTAYYYQTRNGADEVGTQALTECNIGLNNAGGNVISFSAPKTGIELRWLDAHTLEVAVPEGVAGSGRTHDTYYGYPLTYQYRTISPTDAEYEGCFVGGGPHGT
jgi:hypothetical protein